MKIMEIQQQIKELTQKLNYYAKKYYTEDISEISDYEYDQLNRKLLQLEEQYPQYKQPDSPSFRVGGEILSQFSPVTHEVPMESLQDAFSVEELQAFDERVKKVFPNAEYVVELKIDGLSTSITYLNGILTLAATRGDGITGEDVTANIKTIRSVPLKIEEAPPKLIVRGEVYMSKQTFVQLNQQRELSEQPLFANPRNAAAGSLRQLDSAVAAQRGLDIFIFNLQAVEGKTFQTHSQTLQYLKQKGFPVSPYFNVFSDIGQVWQEIQRLGQMRNDLPFGIDGAVVKVNDLTMREQLGRTVKFPKWAIAYKYPPEQKKTRLLDIQINVGRTGVLTPLAILQPVVCAGSTISKATLHNKDFIAQKDIRIGDYVLIQKAGDIIPEVVGVVLQDRSPDAEIFRMPSVCPVCGSHVIQDEEDAFIRCINAECPAQQLKNIIHFAERDAMDIDGLGDGIIQRLLDEKLISTAADLYNLTPEQLEQLDRFGEKSAKNLIDSIQSSKSRNLDRLIYALGIREVGQKAAKILARRFGSMDQLLHADTDQLVQINEIGPITANYIIQYFAEPRNIDFIHQLQTHQINMQYTDDIKDLRFENLSFVLTGTLPSYTRQQAAQIIESLGGKVSSSVSKKTSYVLAGAEAGSKLTKAQNLGIPIIDEETFQKMIQ